MNLPPGILADLIKSLAEIYHFNSDEGKQIIENISDEGKIRLYSILGAEVVNKHRREGSDFLGRDWLFDYFTIESMAKIKSKTHLKKMFSKYLSSDDKLTLLIGFQFSDEYEWGEGRLITFHLMREDMLLDNDFLNYYKGYKYIQEKECIQGSCFCDEWVQKKNNMDCYIEKLQNKFKALRESFVHDSSFNAILPNYGKQGNAASYRSITFGTLITQNFSHHINYECDIKPDDYFNITFKCKKNFLKQNYL